MKITNKFKQIVIAALISGAVLLTTTLFTSLDEIEAQLDKNKWEQGNAGQTQSSSTDDIENESQSLLSPDAYTGSPYAVINNNIPFFSDNEMTATSFEEYSSLDELGRCGVAFANLGTDLMPTEDRESISEVKPSGWVNKPYDHVDGKYLYNRCHLIGFQLAGENANEKNLITGTRYMNVEGMLPFENMVADFLHENPEMHVLYRVTPIYDGNNLVANGVLMEAQSVEDNGEAILFNVFCYNVQPGVNIDYATGDNWESKDFDLSESDSIPTSEYAESMYVLNTNSKKFHLPSCTSINDINSKNMETISSTRDILIAEGYTPCENCNP